MAKEEVKLKCIDWKEFLKKVENHQKRCDEDEECIYCGYRDCPHNEPLHYHHDGCPACIAKEFEDFEYGKETLSEKLWHDLNCDTASYETCMDNIKEFIKELEIEFKVAFCLNPNVQYCGECAVCKNVDRILKRKVGERKEDEK